MKHKRSHIFAIALLPLLLCASACSSSNLIVMLDSVAAAAETAIPILSAAGTLTPEESAAINGYLMIATTNIPKAIQIIENAPGGNVASVASQVVKLVNEIAQTPQLSAKLPPKDVALINAVSLAAQAFLAAFERQTAGLHFSHPELVFAAAGGQSAGPVKLSHADKRRLKHIKARMLKAQKALANK